MGSWHIFWGTCSSEKDNLKKVLKGDLYNCKLCQTEILPECDLNTHLVTTQSVRRHICDKCKNKFTFKNYMKKHSDDTHKVIRHICEECQNKFPHKRDLSKHSDTIHAVIRYQTYLRRMPKLV